MNLHVFVLLWLNCERLAYYNDLYANLLFLEGEERITSESVDKWEDAQPKTRMVFASIMAPVVRSTFTNYARSSEQRSIAFAGIAVERYRRAQGVLPASLDALVPGYLDSVPLSNINGEPLMYRHGEFEFPEGIDTRERFLVNGYMVYGPVYRKETGAFNSFTVALGPVVKIE